MFSLLLVVASGHEQGAEGFAPVPCEAGKEGRQERRASTRSEANTRAAERDRASSRPETMGAQETLAAHSFTASSVFVSCVGNMLNNSQPTTDNREAALKTHLAPEPLASTQTDSLLWNSLRSTSMPHDPEGAFRAHRFSTGFHNSMGILHSFSTCRVMIPVAQLEPIKHNPPLVQVLAGKEGLAGFF